MRFSYITKKTLHLNREINLNYHKIPCNMSFTLSLFFSPLVPSLWMSCCCYTYSETHEFDIMELSFNPNSMKKNIL